MKEYSDGYLISLHRKACLKLYNNKCFFCGTSINQATIDIHHHVKRKNLLLRYDYRNGFPVCRFIHEFNKHFKMSCHQYAETILGKYKIDYELRELREYFQERQIASKQYFIDNNISRAEFKEKMYEELMKIIKNT